MLLRIFLLLLFVWSPASAQAPEDARTELKGTLNEIKASKRREKELEEKNAALERELHTLQKSMVALAKDTKEREEELSSLEEKLDILEEQKKLKSSALELHQKELSEMISAMIKLRKLPPEAIIAMPGKLDETMATARALGLVTRAIEEEAESLKAQIAEMDLLENKIKDNRKAVTLKKEALEAKQQELLIKVKERSNLQATLGGKEREEKERSAHLIAKSQSLQELLDSLEREEHSNAWEHEKVPGVSKSHEKHASQHALRSFVDARGSISIPAAGKIISTYGDTRAGTTFSKGFVIETRPQANVVAPFDGEVVFAGMFRDYGHMVIIRHSNNYHTLVSGMEHLDCSPGQFLLEGEPIGAMGRHASSTHLYIELRKDEKPVDPASWFKRAD